MVHHEPDTRGHVDQSDDVLIFQVAIDTFLLQDPEGDVSVHVVGKAFQKHKGHGVKLKKPTAGVSLALQKSETY
ncbi:MAG TPA: hypothetical protein VEB63_03980 [Chitinophagaceae bacterium]|nr:hypothetical protein [Chitinophagaceae bacterium]